MRGRRIGAVAESMAEPGNPPDTPEGASAWREDGHVRPDTIGRLERVVELLAVHGAIEAACERAHCSKATFYEFKERHPDFAEEVKRALGRRERAVAGEVCGVEERAAFVEWMAPVLAGGTECVMELEDGRGAKLRIQLKGAIAPEVAALVRELWRSER